MCETLQIILVYFPLRPFFHINIDIIFIIFLLFSLLSTFTFHLYHSSTNVFILQIKNSSSIDLPFFSSPLSLSFLMLLNGFFACQLFRLFCLKHTSTNRLFHSALVDICSVVDVLSIQRLWKITLVWLNFAARTSNHLRGALFGVMWAFSSFTTQGFANSSLSVNSAYVREAFGCTVARLNFWTFFHVISIAFRRTRAFFCGHGALQIVCRKCFTCFMRTTFLLCSSWAYVAFCFGFDNVWCWWSVCFWCAELVDKNHWSRLHEKFEFLQN